MSSTLGYLPVNVRAGETIWISAANTTQTDRNDDIILTDYLPTTHALYYDFAADTPITVTGAANDGNTGWTLEVTAAQTLVWKAGVMHFSARVVDGTTGRTIAVDDGTITVQASPLAVSQYKAAYTAAETAIAQYGSNPLNSFNVGDMTITYKSLADLIGIRNHFKYLMEQETSRRPRRIIRTRFAL